MAQLGSARSTAGHGRLGGAPRLGQPARAGGGRCTRERAHQAARRRSSVIAALLVLVGLLGLRFLGQSNARVERLGTLQLRSATYRDAADPGERCCGSCSGSAPAANPERHADRCEELAAGRTAHGRSSTRRSASPSRSSDRRRARRPTASCRRRPTSGCSSRSGATTTGSTTRCQPSPGLDRRRRCRLPGAPVPRRRSTPTTTCSHVTNDLAERTSDQTGRPDRREPQRLHVVAQPLHRRRRRSASRSRSGSGWSSRGR